MAQTPFDFSWLTSSLSAFAGGSAVYLARIFFDRRKLKAEDTSAELDADTKAVELYEKYAALLSPKIETLQEKVEKLNDQVIALKEENANLRIEASTYKSENASLKAEIKIMHAQITELKSKVQ